MSRILHLTLKKKWFDMIATGEKLEEYRDVKPYWIKRLTLSQFHQLGTIELICALNKKETYCKFDIIRFKNGYQKNAPTMDVECNGIRYGFSNIEWIGYYTQKWFLCIELGKILSIKNYPKKNQ